MDKMGDTRNAYSICVVKEFSCKTMKETEDAYNWLKFMSSDNLCY
jgi:hypothetical protein